MLKVIDMRRSRLNKVPNHIYFHISVDFEELNKQHIHAFGHKYLASYHASYQITPINV